MRLLCSANSDILILFLHLRELRGVPVFSMRDCYVLRRFTQDLKKGRTLFILKKYN